ncbi:MAG: response regulator [Phycisphaerales bacterium]
MPKSVLIVDDEPRITIALMTRLQSAGYTVYHAINGLAGVEAAALHHPDAIVMDIRMPDIDGFEACERIRRLPGLTGVPVVFLSANVRDEARVRAIRAGGSVFLSKPYEAADVLKTIEDAMAEAEHIEEAIDA